MRLETRLGAILSELLGTERRVEGGEGQVTGVVVNDRPGVPRDEQQEVFRANGVELMFGDIKAALHEFGVKFDVYFHENELHESGAVEKAIARLNDLGVAKFRLAEPTPRTVRRRR